MKLEVTHDRLVYKMRQLWYSTNIIIQMMALFQCDKHLIVTMINDLSNYREEEAGVPQGAVLFSIFSAETWRRNADAVWRWHRNRLPVLARRHPKVTSNSRRHCWRTHWWPVRIKHRKAPSPRECVASICYGRTMVRQQ